jgi:hypothetical protein
MITGSTWVRNYSPDTASDVLELKSLIYAGKSPQ